MVAAIAVAESHGCSGDPVVVPAADDVAVSGLLLAIQDAVDAVIDGRAITRADPPWTSRATVAGSAVPAVRVGDGGRWNVESGRIRYEVVSCPFDRVPVVRQVLPESHSVEKRR